MPDTTPRRPFVVALTDTRPGGRLERHARALAAASADAAIEVVGGSADPVVTAPKAEPRIVYRHVAPPELSASRAGAILAAGRAPLRAVRLARALLGHGRPDVVLVEAPASSTTYATAWAASRLAGARLVIDWRNRTERPGVVHEHPRKARALTRREGRWARRAHGHLAASRALAEWLARTHRVDAAVLPDRPSSWTAPPRVPAADALWQRIAGPAAASERRPPLVVSATGWTPADDFDLLLEGLERAERRLAAASPDHDGPDLLVLLTGRGPLQTEIQARLARRHLQRVSVRSLWLEPADFLMAVGIADLGLCVHQSATGLDLPSTLAVFRGAGVPVLVADYAPVLGEAVTDGREGLVFRDPGGLARALTALATGATDEAPALGRARAWLAAHPADGWDEDWRAIARPVLGI